MSAEQTVDWADPAVQSDYLRVHRRDRWRTSGVTLAALLTLIGVLQFVWLHRWVLLLGAVALLRLVVLRVQVTLSRLREFLPSSGDLARYRLDGQTLHIQNTAGDHEVRLSEMYRFRSYPAGIVVDYVGTSEDAETFTFTLPNGVARYELERRHRRPRSSPD